MPGNRRGVCASAAGQTAQPVHADVRDIRGNCNLDGPFLRAGYGDLESRPQYRKLPQTERGVDAGTAWPVSF